MDNNNLLDKEFNTISKLIVINYAKNYCIKRFDSIIELKDEELYIIGKDIIDKYSQIESLKANNETYKKTQKLLKDIIDYESRG